MLLQTQCRRWAIGNGRTACCRTLCLSWSMSGLRAWFHIAAELWRHSSTRLLSSSLANWMRCVKSAHQYEHVRCAIASSISTSQVRLSCGRTYDGLLIADQRADAHAVHLGFRKKSTRCAANHFPSGRAFLQGGPFKHVHAMFRGGASPFPVHLRHLWSTHVSERRVERSWRR